MRACSYCLYILPINLLKSDYSQYSLNSSIDVGLNVPYSLKFSRVKNFEDFEDICLVLKILLSNILVLQRRHLKLLRSKVMAPLRAN